MSRVSRGVPDSSTILVPDSSIVPEFEGSLSVGSKRFLTLSQGEVDKREIEEPGQYKEMKQRMERRKTCSEYRSSAVRTGLEAVLATNEERTFNPTTLLKQNIRGVPKHNSKR